MPRVGLRRLAEVPGLRLDSVEVKPGESELRLPTESTWPLLSVAESLGVMVWP